MAPGLEYEGAEGREIEADGASDEEEIEDVPKLVPEAEVGLIVLGELMGALYIGEGRLELPLLELPPLIVLGAKEEGTSDEGDREEPTPELLSTLPVG